MDKISHFQFYETFDTQLEGLPEEMQNKFYRAIIKYGLYGEVPEFENPLENVVFKQFKFAIDNQKTKSGINAENGKNGGRPKNPEKPTETEQNPEKPTETEQNPEKPTETENAEIEIEEEREEEGEDERETRADAPSLLPSLSFPQENYAKEVFDAWHGAGLPCCNGNFISFMQKDFKNALQYLGGINSADVIQAAKNYAALVKNKDADVFWKNQYPTFERFCSGKMLSRFLPDNFRPEAFLKTAPPPQKQRAGALVFERRKCACCGAEYTSSGDCTNCGYTPGDSVDEWRELLRERQPELYARCFAAV